MKGLDTNVLVRYIMQDDAKQARKATKIIESMDASNPGFVSNISLVELYWVLTSCYDLSNAQVTQAIEIMMRAKTFVLERPEQIARALNLFKAGKADFADCLIHRSAIDAGCTETLTFDVSAAKHAGMTLIP
jgi:predicted nucleic-acid-binding protein